jgi:hypothetical protein
MYRYTQERSGRWGLRVGGLARLLGYALVGIVALAVGLGRVEAPASAPHAWKPASPLVWVREVDYRNRTDPTVWLDPRSGETISLAPLRQGRVMNPSISPWQTEAGGSEMAASWLPIGGRAANVPGMHALVRIALPERRISNHVALQADLIDPPCWLPGPGARVLFATWDGGLYFHTFEDGRNGQADPRPKRLAWQTRCLDGGDVAFFRGLFLPADPRLKDFVLASIEWPERVEGAVHNRSEELWWLRLDRDVTAIVGACRIWSPQSPRPSDCAGEERFGVLKTNDRGDMLLAYLLRPTNSLGWQLRVVPVEVDALTGAPVAHRDASRTLATGCLGTSPTFSADGRSVYCIVRAAGQLRVARSPVEATAGPSQIALVGPPIATKVVAPAAVSTTIATPSASRPDGA